MKYVTFGVLLVGARRLVLLGLLLTTTASFAQVITTQGGAVAPSFESRALKSAKRAWPDAPRSDDSALAKKPKPDAQRVPVTEFSEPQIKPPSNDPLQEINEKGLVQGRLVYTPTIKVEGQDESQSFLVLRRVGFEGEVARIGTEVATYNLRVPWYYVFNSQFSPDGRYISFNEGDP